MPTELPARRHDLLTKRTRLPRPTPCPPELVHEWQSFLEEDFFKAFIDDSRLRIFLILMEKGEMTVNAVSDAMEISQSNVSRHLAFLKRAGITVSRKHGRETYYKIDYQNIAHRLRSILGIVQQCCPANTEE